MANLKVLSDILIALDSGNLAVPMMLDLSAAFDGVDQSALLQRLKKSYGVSVQSSAGSPHILKIALNVSVVSSLLQLHPNSSMGCHKVQFLSLSCSTTVCFTTVVLLQFVKRLQLLPHAYADDTQIYGFCVPSETKTLIERISTCFDSVSEWMMANGLPLNPQKTEVMWCSSARRQHQVPFEPVLIGNTSVPTVSSVRDLGVHINSHITFSTHFTAVVRTCFAVLRQIRSIEVLKDIVVFVLLLIWIYLFLLLVELLLVIVPPLLRPLELLEPGTLYRLLSDYLLRYIYFVVVLKLYCFLSLILHRPKYV